MEPASHLFHPGIKVTESGEKVEGSNRKKDDKNDQRDEQNNDQSINQGHRLHSTKGVHLMQS
jgi:hypothetical protein